MIESLHIENIAVVRSLDIDLRGGFTVLTGETGAGKSIIIDSLGLLLGSRADKELIRTGERGALVSAVFSGLSKNIIDSFAELGFDISDGSVMLSRAITSSSSSAKINGRGVTLAVLRTAAEKLFNIHGQNDNQQLLDPCNHVNIIDSYAQNGELLAKYSEIYEKILQKRAQIQTLEKDSREQYRMRETLKYQISDIDAGKLRVGEEEALEELVLKLRSAEKISKSASLVDKALKGGEKGMGAIYLSERAAGALESIAAAVPEATELAARLRNICYELEDIAEISADIVDFGGEDPSAKLDRAEGRLDAISRLKKKYGSTVEEVLEYRAEAAQKLDLIENAGERREDMENELNALCDEAKVFTDRLTEKRRSASEELKRRVTETLAFLDMPKVRFDVSIRAADDFGANGRDEVEFLISTNVGEPLLPMAKIASGGELARIMLALKNALNESDGVQTVIFDEIDTGISGKTSRKVGIKLKEIGRASQVLCVTHSAQIASLADSHLYISKREVEGRVETSLSVLDENARVLEIARILGGIEITEKQTEAAREMIAEGETYK
ncbi:MAG: DNA repair protein RecN [Ruminococcaceae bacterium]|nr:DNA repair protein RecN [Oscillospiraceae bacterium]